MKLGATSGWFERVGIVTTEQKAIGDGGAVGWGAPTENRAFVVEQLRREKALTARPGYVLMKLAPTNSARNRGGHFELASGGFL